MFGNHDDGKWFVAASWPCGIWSASLFK